KQSMMFLAHERSPLARRRQLDLSELCETPIGTPSLPAELVPAFRSAGFKDFPSVRCDDMALLLDLAASTELVAMAPAIAIPMLPGHRGLTRLPVKVPFDLFAHPGIMSHRRQTIGPAGRMLIKLVQQRFAATT
ncbi:MAG: LysR family transcriptional regulator substrate-binding protein, partial [Burkholderiaceae bacterium]